jgi:50S ribosomal protein L16 3-hydroxylase
MLRLPGNLDAEKFLARYWQKQPLFMPQAFDTLRPSVTRNELGWLATLDDVESRLVHTDRGNGRTRYYAESGPFSVEYLAALPKRDWTLLVHDVEKHLPVMRRLLSAVPFIPDWRIDDLMVSFAAPGGSVGPHRDNYDVFLCQGVGVRAWRVTSEDVERDNDASEDLALTAEFAGEASYSAKEGDVLYLPPGIAHWGVAKRACITYSIGMRAPLSSDFASEPRRVQADERFYSDEDLQVNESRPGYISDRALRRAMRLLGATEGDRDTVAESLGRYVTQTKGWITPDGCTDAEARKLLNQTEPGVRLVVHGMARIAFDDRNLYVNGSYRPLLPQVSELVEKLCARRALSRLPKNNPDAMNCLRWMLVHGAFEIPEHL